MGRVRRAGALLVLLSVLLCLPLVGAIGEEIVEWGGIRYRLTQDKAVIIGFSDGAETARLPATLRGLPTAAPDAEDQEQSPPLGKVDELILEEGLTSREPYLGLRHARIRRVTLSGSLVLFPSKERSWFEDSWLDCFPWLEEVTLPAGLSREDFDRFMVWGRDAYSNSSRELRDLSGDFWGFANFWDYDKDDGDGYFVDELPYRWLSRVRIPPENPFLYDIDGVVFDKETDELLFCASGRSGAYAVPEGTTGIGREAFQDCDRLEAITLPRSVTAIGERAFAGCAGLRTVPLPPTVRDIGAYAFNNCISLDTLILPDGVRVGAGAFEYCTGLKSVYAPGEDSVIDPGALRTAPMELVVYAKKDSSAYRAAEANDLLWAETDGEPVRLKNPAWIQTAIVHDEEASGQPALYAKAEVDSPVLARYPVGTTARVLDVADGWAHVKFYEGEGYMPLESLYLVDKSDVRERVLEVEMEEMGEGYAVYTGPSLSAPAVPVQRGYYGVLQRYGTWYLVEKDGETYYAPLDNAWPRSMCAVPAKLYVVAAKGGEARARLYEQPDRDSRSLGVFYNGTQVEVLDEEPEVNGFCPVRVRDAEGDRHGYMEKAALVEMHAQWFYYGR